ncbi:alpha/beta hydrolase [Chloroflexota bacterium]
MNYIPARFPCGDITLEGEWLLPEGEDPFPSVIVCHPHPLYGGDMKNNVVAAICAALSHQSVAAFRFNFRGVGGSEGSFGEGIAEQEDVKAALDFILSSPDTDSEKIGLAGYSFGATVALAVALQDERVSLMALVSAPLSNANWVKLKGYGKPKLLITGDADLLIPLRHLQQHIKDIPHPEQYQIVSGADHFLWGYEEEVAKRVSRFFTAGFSQI